MKNIVIVLVKPQLGENIGMAARAMFNFGFAQLRIVEPRDGWPSDAAISSSAGASSVVKNAEIHQNFLDAISDCEYVYATSARKRDLNIDVVSSENLADHIQKHNKSKKIAILFGPENSGLTNSHISHSNAILTIPVNNECPSINLANSVGVICYELSKRENLGRFTNKQANLATRKEIDFMWEQLATMLTTTNFYQVPEKKQTMDKNIHSMFNRISNLTKSEVNSLIGIFKSLYNHK